MSANAPHTLRAASVAMVALGLAAQEPLDPSKQAALDLMVSILNTPVTVASGKELSLRDSPGIITVVTREEILSSGARDLLEYLQRVPGFQPTYTGQNTTSLNIRGLHAMEGKFLVLIDGVEMNERLYGTITLDNRFHLDQVQRIEIIRGPGSARWGGFAEYAVINVVTRTGRDLQGAAGSLSYGLARGGFLRRTASAAYGEERGSMNWSVTVTGGLGSRTSEETLRHASYARDLVQTPGGWVWTYIPLKLDLQSQGSRMDSLMFNAGLAWHGLKVRLVHDHVKYSDIDLSDMDRIQGFYTETLGVEASYAWRLSDTLTLTPRLSYKEDLPWTYPPPRMLPWRKVVRKLASLTLAWTPNPTVDFQGGYEYFQDHAKSFHGDSTMWPMSNGGTSISYLNRALFAQGILSTPIGLVTLGARYEAPAIGKAAFIPRVAWTFNRARFHAKLLAAKSFRAPTIQNIEDNLFANNKTLTIRPEETTTYEAEAGYNFTPHFLGILSVFRTHTKNNLLFPYKVSYANGAEGVEGELHYRRPWGHLIGTVSLYQARDNEVLAIRVPGEDLRYLGAASSKITFSGHFNLPRSLVLDTHWMILGPRYAYPHYMAQKIERAGGYTLGSLSLDWIVSPNRMKVGLLVSNVLDARILHHMGWAPYGIGSDPVPGTGGREFSLRLSYNY